MRLATHASMRRLVERHSLEFYPLGGDPRVLAEFAAESRGAHLLKTRPRGCSRAVLESTSLQHRTILFVL